MNTEIIIATIIAIVALVVGLLQLAKFRRTFLVPEGHAGLLYHKGKFIEVLLAGQHIRWGRKFTLGVAEVLKAKQEGHAALERARGESASLRNLANAARVLEGNPALMNLRLMQSLSAAQNAGNTLVLGMPGGFVPLKNGKAGAPASTADDAKDVGAAET